jgi:hypothetical protein
MSEQHRIRLVVGDITTLRYSALSAAFEEIRLSRAGRDNCEPNSGRRSTQLLFGANQNSTCS